MHDPHEVRGIQEREPQAALEAGQQHLLAEPPQPFAPVEPVVGGGERAPGDAAHDRQVVEEIAPGRLLAFERGEHAMRERRRAQPAAGERHDDGVLAHDVGRRAHARRHPACPRLVARLVENRGGAAAKARGGDEEDGGETHGRTAYAATRFAARALEDPV